MTEAQELVERELLDSRISILKKEAIAELNKYPRKILPTAVLEMGLGSFFIFGSEFIFSGATYSAFLPWLIGSYMVVGISAFAIGVHFLFDAFEFPREMRRKYPQLYGKTGA